MIENILFFKQIYYILIILITPQKLNTHSNVYARTCLMLHIYHKHPSLFGQLEVGYFLQINIMLMND